MGKLKNNKTQKRKKSTRVHVRLPGSRRTTRRSKKGGRPNGFDIILQILMTLIIFSLLFGGFSAIERYNKLSEERDMSLSELVKQVRDGSVEKIEVRGELLRVYAHATGTEAQSDYKEVKKEGEASLTETLTNLGVTTDELAHVQVVIKDPSGVKYWMRQIIPLVLPVLLIFGLLLLLSRGKGGPMQVLSFGSSRARLQHPDDDTARVTFKDVAGAREAKAELEEIVDFLRNPKKFIRIGAEIPKGVLLMGAPGCGKTLLARAVAGEAKVPFYSIAGSEFVDMFVGVGASRTRDLFEQAKKNAPSIIFIDEIDAVGRVRGGGFGGGNDEREQTLNQILVEMDGFEANEKVVVMAATNRPDVLDPALLRPGRFDRRVVVELPDKEAREEILAIHMRKKKKDKNIDLAVIAQRTPGFSGADLANLANEAAILAASNRRKKVTQEDLLNSIEKVMIGPERKSHALSKREKRITAYHEAGHALIASVLSDSDPVHKISIISRGRAAGYTLKLPDEDKKMQSKKEFEADIAVSLGGYIAEKMIFNDVTTGPSNDLQVLTNTARNMVTRWGMSDEIGPLALLSDGGEVMFGMGPGAKEYSEEMSAKIDAEVRKIVDAAYACAESILTKYREALDAVAEKLIEVENLEREEYEALLSEHNVPLNSRET